MSDDLTGDDGEPLDVVDEADGPLPEGVTVTDGGRFQCPDCERSYKNVDDLQKHRRLQHAFRSSSRRGRPQGSKNKGGAGSDGSPRREQAPGLRRVRREKDVRETLEEIVSFSRAVKGERVDVRSLVDVIDRDKQRMAVSIAWVAEKFNPLGALIDLTMGHGGAITIVKGFSGVGGWMISRWRQLIAERESEEVVPFYAGQPGDPELEIEETRTTDGDPFAPAG